MNSEDDSDSDYVVEHYIKPDKITKKPINDDSADLLGNFDDEKRKQIEDPSRYPNQENEDHFSEEVNNNSEDQEMNEDSDEGDESEPEGINTKLSKDQLDSLLKGASKKSRFVLYVTNLNFETTKDDLENYFSQAGEVKGIRIPPKRRGGFAFVEMSTIEGFQKAFEFHNTELHGRAIKVQISEGGKRKSANKKNIMKQKNRKLAEMRNEQKRFSKSGKNYDKDIKKEIQKEMLARKRWRKKKPAPG